MSNPNSNLIPASIQEYMSRIAHIDPVFSAEEYAIMLVLRQGSSEAIEHARNRLIEGNLWIVPQVVLEYVREHPKLTDDIIQEGTLALIELCHKFTPSAESFRPLAVFRIQKSVTRYLKKHRREQHWLAQFRDGTAKGYYSTF